MEFYLERKTMTQWRKVGDTFEPLTPIEAFKKIGRDPQDVLKKGLFMGPYHKREETKCR